MSLKLFSRPRDRSLQAFKDWIQGMTYLLQPQAEKTVATRQWIAEAGWVDNWKKFWDRVDRGSQSTRPAEG